MRKFELYGASVVDDSGLVYIETIEAKNDEVAWGLAYGKTLKLNWCESEPILYEVKTLKDLKVGEYFTFKPHDYPTEKQVYIRDEYDRSTKKYGYYPFSSICNGGLKKGDTKVYVGFTF